MTASEAFSESFARYVESAGMEAAGMDIAQLKAFILRNTVPKACIPKRLAELRDDLATIEHERWSHWQQYMHEKCFAAAGEPGALVIPSDLVARWEKQAATPFAGLSETEKNSDREQVDRYLPLLANRLGA